MIPYAAIIPGTIKNNAAIIRVIHFPLFMYKLFIVYQNEVKIGIKRDLPKSAYYRMLKLCKKLQGGIV
uniref:Uncharacterized protein n=1 Tax=Virgibacillus oceani TaxID=1479511 RepID=A0A917LXS0_9BACI|nr:hypothetical protein GCM10011398_04460 [Virgibacillus oceani]